MKIFIKADHNELPGTAKAFLKTPKTTEIIKLQTGEYFHYGLKNSLIDILNKTRLEKIIKINIGVDGAPLSKSSNQKLWPIIGSVKNKNYDQLTPFLIGSYHGDTNPSSGQFFMPFINEYKELNQEGFMYNNKNTQFSYVALCVMPRQNA